MSDDISKTEQDEVRLWQSKIELAHRYLEKFGNTGDRWDDNVKAMAGDFNSLNELGDEAIDVNMVRSTLKAVLPPLWLGQPHVSVRPKKKDFVRGAEVTEMEVNYWLRELEVRHQVRQVAHDAEATNLGYLYVGYVSDKREVENEEGERVEPIPTIRFKQPFVRRMSPKNVRVPPGYGTLEECPWVDLVFYRSVDYVTNRYGEARTKDIPATLGFKESAGTNNDTDSFKNFLESDDAQLIELHNIWDKETKKVYVLAKDHDQYLEEPKAWPYEVEGFPLVRYQPECVPDEYFGTPPISFYLPQNKELNAVRTAMRKRRNRTKSVIFMDSRLGDELVDAYADAEDGVVLKAEVPDGQGRLGDHIQIDNGLPMDQGDLVYDAVMKGDIREQSGLGAERRGSGDPNVDSATASANIEKGVQIREADRGDGIRLLYLGVSKKLWMILKQFPNVKRTRLITGPDGAILGQRTYTLKELRGEYDFDLDFGAVLSDNPATRSTVATLNYNLLRADPLVDPNRLILDVFKSQNKPDPENYMLRLRDPQEEHAMFLQGLPVEAHERDDHMAHMQQHDMFQEQIDQMVRQMDADPNQQDSSQRRKLSVAQILALSHDNSHMQKVVEMQQQNSGTGKPVAENLLRNQIKASSGSETTAELSGQPLSPDQMVS